MIIDVQCKFISQYKVLFSFVSSSYDAVSILAIMCRMVDK
jgi:hypothetical protein